MAKSWFWRLMDHLAGKIPEGLRTQLQSESLILWDEGIRVGLRFKNYKAPGQRFTGFKNIAGYGALTQKRLVSTGYSNCDFDLPLDRISKDNLEYGLRKPNCFYFAFEASEFYEDRSGRAEVRLFTPKAGEFVRRLDSLLAER